MRRLSRGGLALAAVCVTGLAALSANPASATVATGKPLPKPTVFQKAFPVVAAGASSIAVDAKGIAHVALYTGPSALISCTIQLGARTCGSQVSLPPLTDGDSIDLPPVVVLPSPGDVEIVDSEERAAGGDDAVPTIAWVSHDNGASFGAPFEVAATPTPFGGTVNAAAVVDGGSLVMLDGEGGQERVEPVEQPSSSPLFTPLEPSETNDGASVSEVPEDAAPGIVALPDGSLITAHTRLGETSGPDMTIVQAQSAPGAAPTTIATLAGEDIRSLVTGPSGTYLLTRSTDAATSSSDKVLIHKIVGGAITATFTLPRVSASDADGYRLAEDAQGALHAIWLNDDVVAIEPDFFRLFSATSTDGGRSWTTVLLDGSPKNTTYDQLAISPGGYGIALETAVEGSSASVGQPVLIEPRLSLKAAKSVVTGKSITFTGTATPGIAGRTVIIQQVISGHVTKVATAKEAKNGTFRVKFTERRAGAKSYQGFVDGVPGVYDSATSGPVSVKVVTPPLR